MTELLVAFVWLMAMATLIDLVIGSEAVRAWRANTRALEQRLDEMDVLSATRAASRHFRDLFDAIYHPAFWSGQRFVRSCISSAFAVGMVIAGTHWMFGDLSVINQEIIWRYPFYILAFLLINLIADYFSLQETRWILSLNRAGYLWLTFVLFVVDLVLTTLIFMAVAYPVWFILIGVGSFFEHPSGFVFHLISIAVKLLFLSTFFTSALWFLYVFVAMFIRALSRLSPFLRLVLGTIGESPMPARASAGFIAVFMVIIYGGVSLAGWLMAPPEAVVEDYAPPPPESSSPPAPD